jgi:hypothetical protein
MDEAAVKEFLSYSQDGFCSTMLSNIVNNQADFSRLLGGRKQPYSPELASLYRRVRVAHEQKDFPLLSRCVIRLTSFSAEDALDLDSAFTDNKIDQMIMELINDRETCNLLLISLISFLANAFYRKDSLMLPVFLDLGLFQRLMALMEMPDEDVRIVVLQCMINISEAEVETAAEMLKDFTLGSLKRSLISESMEEAKLATKLLLSVCKHNKSNDNLHAIACMIDVVLAVHSQTLKLWPALISSLCELIKSREAVIQIISNDLRMKFMESVLLEVSEAKVLIAVLEFLCKILSFDVFLSFISFENLLTLFSHLDGRVSLCAIRLLNNAAICDTTGKLNAFFSRADTLNAFSSVLETGGGRNQIEMMHLLTTLISLRTRDMLADFVDRNFVRHFVAGLEIEEQRLVEAILYGINCMLKQDFPPRLKSKVRDQFFEVGGKEVIEKLRESEDARISELSECFYGLWIDRKERIPFAFKT